MADLNEELKEHIRLWNEVTDAIERTKDSLAKATNPADIRRFKDELKDLRGEQKDLNQQIRVMESSQTSFASATAQVTGAAAMGGFFGSRFGGRPGGIFGAAAGIGFGITGAGERAAEEARRAGGGSLAQEHARQQAIEQAQKAAIIPVIGLIGEGASMLISGAKQFLEVPAKILGAVSQYVQQIDPGRMLLMNQAIQDLQAAIGSGLTPIIDAATPIIDMMNRAVTSFMEALRPAIQILSTEFQANVGPLLQQFQVWATYVAGWATEFVRAAQPLLDAIRELSGLFQEINQGVLEAFRDLMTAMMPIIRTSFEVLAATVRGFAIVLRQVMDFLGISRPGLPGAPTGTITTAARPAQYIETEEIGRQARLAAFGARSEQQQNTEALNANTVATISLMDIFNRFLDTLAVGFTTWVDRLIAGIADVFTNFSIGFYTVVNDIFKNVMDFVNTAVIGLKIAIGSAIMGVGTILGAIPGLEAVGSAIQNFGSELVQSGQQQAQEMANVPVQGGIAPPHFGRPVRPGEAEPVAPPGTVSWVDTEGNVYTFPEGGGPASVFQGAGGFGGGVQVPGGGGGQGGGGMNDQDVSEIVDVLTDIFNVLQGRPMPGSPAAPPQVQGSW